MVEWLIFKCKKDFEVFFGYVNYYREYIKSFVEIVVFLYIFIGLKIKFIWNKEKDIIFIFFKEVMINFVVLGYFIDDGMFILDMDVLDMVIGVELF